MGNIEERFHQLPDAQGHFGQYGGRFVPETLMHPIEQLIAAYEEASRDPEFQRELSHLLADYVGRPTPLMLAERLTEKLGGGRIYLKREDLCHTGAHKINNAVGQVLLAKRMGKTRIIAETGAGQHGVATATVCALHGTEVYRLHGHRRHATAGVERLSYAAAGRRSCRCRSGKPYAQRRDQRSSARLGHERRRDLLPARFRHGTAPIPCNGARLSIGDRPRSTSADSGSRRPSARSADRQRRRGQQFDRSVL